MAAVEVTISGVLYDKINRTTQPVVLIGEATLTGLGVGGGPVIPPEGGGGDKPPTSPGHPAFPIWGGPGAGFPDKPGYPPVVGGGPIVPPDKPPVIPPDQPPVQWKAVWHPTEGWIVVGVINPDIPHPTPS